MNKLLLVFIAATAATWTTPVAADFGDYRSHEQQGQSLLVTTDVGQLRITVIDEAGFEVHYVADGSTQYPSFALAGPPPQLHARLEETDATLVFAADELTAVIDKSPVRIRYRRDGQDLVGEESGYFASEDEVGFRFALDDGEKVMGGGQRVLGMDGETAPYGMCLDGGDPRAGRGPGSKPRWTTCSGVSARRPSGKLATSCRRFAAKCCAATAWPGSIPANTGRWTWTASWASAPSTSRPS